MKKIKQIAAIVGIVLLVLMYVITFIFALIDDPRTMNLLAGSLATTFFLPIVLWFLNLLRKL